MTLPGNQDYWSPCLCRPVDVQSSWTAQTCQRDWCHRIPQPFFQEKMFVMKGSCSSPDSPRLLGLVFRFNSNTILLWDDGHMMVKKLWYHWRWGSGTSTRPPGRSPYVLQPTLLMRQTEWSCPLPSSLWRVSSTSPCLSRDGYSAPLLLDTWAVRYSGQDWVLSLEEKGSCCLQYFFGRFRHFWHHLSPRPFHGSYSSGSC